ncbi:Protein K03A11.4, partial [Aphelenchoides avenae]
MKCKPSFVPKTRVNKGKIEVDGEFRDHRCEFRCNYPLNDWNVTLGEWLDVSQTPDCDVFEVRCTNAGGTMDYEFLHAQIYRNDSKSEPKEDKPDPPKVTPSSEDAFPDVYLLVLDSVSTPQIIRSWPKTMRVLLEEMNGVHFRHVNKLGEGSSENAYAMLLGRQALSLPARLGYDPIPADIPMKELCRLPMDEEPYVGYEFSRRGYATMMCEDWYTALNYPDCVGFRKPPADHYFVPFALRYDWSKEGKQSKTLFRNLEHNSCTPQYKYSMAYLKDFIDVYPERPKWSMTWISTLAHNNGNSLYFTDDDFEAFFKEYKEK